MARLALDEETYAKIVALAEKHGVTPAEMTARILSKKHRLLAPLVALLRRMARMRPF